MAGTLWTRLKIHMLFHSGVAFMYRQLWRRPPRLPAGTSLAGQTAIITGANTGLGLEAARQLLDLGLARVILAVRTPDKGEAAAAGLRSVFPDAVVHVWPLDLEDYASVASFADRCRALDRIDIVVLNAGVQNRTRRVVASTGREQTFQVNYLSTALLALLLLPVLRNARAGPGAGAVPPPARLVVVTSTMAFFAKFGPGPVFRQFDEPYDVTQWYAREKLLLHALVVRLASMVAPEAVVVVAVCPGLVGATDIWRDLNESPLLRAVFGAYFALFGRSLAAGASTYVDAVVRCGRESHGGHLSDWMLCPHPSEIYTEKGAAFRQQAWGETLRELDFAGVSRIVEDLGSGGAR